MDAILKKMAAILNLNFFTDDVKKKMVPNFFEISTPKLTKLAEFQIPKKRTDQWNKQRIYERS